MHLKVKTAILTSLWLIQFMGVGSTKTVAQQLKINEDDWQYRTIEHNQQIVKHRHVDLEGEVTLIPSDPLYSVEDQLDIYNFRKNQEKALVEVYCADYLKSTHATMCGNQLNIKVIHERIPQRLRDLPPLSFPQAVYVLSQALRGFQECYDKVGPFEVTDRMIGLNTKGNAKVWLNENFAENHPTSERPALQIIASAAHKNSASQEEALFVRCIIDVVRSKLQERKFPLEFEKALKTTSGFVQTYSGIENYCESKKVWVPDRIAFEDPIRLEEGPIEQTALKAGNNIGQSHATYVPNYKYSHPASSRDTYVTPYYASNPNIALTPNSKRNAPPFGNTQNKYYPYEYQQIDVSNVQPMMSYQAAYSRSGFTYKPI